MKSGTYVIAERPRCFLLIRETFAVASIFFRERLLLPRLELLPELLFAFTIFSMIRSSYR